MSILVKVHPADGTTLLGPIEYLNKQTVHKKGVEIALKYKIVQYFGHSSVITVALIEKQEQLGLKKQKLIQNCPIEYGSYYYMKG